MLALLAETADLAAPQVLSIVASGVLTAGSLIIWIALIRRWQRGLPALNFFPRQVVPWRAVDVLIILLFSLVAVGALSTRYHVEAGVETSVELKQSALIAMAGMNLVCVGAGVVLLMYRAGANRRDLGLPGSFQGLTSDAVLGGLTFLACWLPVYAIQGTIWIIRTNVEGWEPETHVLLQVLSEDTGLSTLLMVGVAAVIAAPISEEFMFRLVFQGWLERCEIEQWWRVARNNQQVRPDSDDEDSPTADEVPPEDLPKNVDNMVISGFTPRAGGEGATAGPLGVIPIAVSSVLFAVLHAGNSVTDPLGLLPFAIILGYVYHRTHRILPCIVAHLLFNGVTVGMVWFNPLETS